VGGEPVLQPSIILVNLKGHRIALIGFDTERSYWCINIYSERGFASEKAALEFWEANFDRETRGFRGEPPASKKCQAG
jgi:hypothetical protein